MDMLTVVLIVSSLIVIASSVFFQYRAKHKDGLNIPPGRLGWPLIGETFEWSGAEQANRAATFFDKRVAKYGPVFKTRHIGQPTVVLPTPSGNKFLFSNEDKLVVNAWPKVTIALLGEHALSVKNGEEHRRLKQQYMAFLKPEALQRYIPKASTIAKTHISKWNTDEHVLIYDKVKAFTFSLVCSLLLGLDDQGLQEKLRGPFYEYVKGIFSLPVKIPGTRCYKAFKARETIFNLLDPVISNRRKELEYTKDDTRDILSVFLTTCDENGKLMSTAEIKDNLLVLLFAGHDTNSSALTMTIKLLAENPYWKEQLLREHMEIRESKGDQQDYLLDWEDLKKMKWTWKVAMESIRLYPPVQGSYRKAIKDFEFAGYHIPKGWQLYWTLNTTRLKPEYFPEPEKFDPRRFDGNGPEPYVFTPFGGGPRMCPGNEFARMEFLVLIHYLVLNYDWDLVMENERVTIDPMPIPVHGLPVKVTKR